MSSTLQKAWREGAAISHVWKATVCSLFLQLTHFCAAQDGEAIMRRLKDTWNASSAEVLPQTGLNAPNGHIVLETPDLNGKVLRRVDEPGIVMVKAELVIGENHYYISDWSWLRVLEGKKPNWIFIKGGKPRIGGQGDAFWQGYYASLTNDQTSWNCYEAYAFLEKNVENQGLVDFLVAKLATETDIQAKSCVVALLCRSTKFAHDRAFAETAVSMIESYQRYRVSGYGGGERDKREERDPGRQWAFVSSNGAALNRVWSSFIVRNAPKYETVIAKALFDEETDLFTRWICVHALARHNLIRTYHSKFKPAFFRTLFEGLRSDEREWNAQFATRMLVILDEVSRPYIVQRMNAARLDDQEQMVLGLLERGILKPENREAFEGECGDLATDVFEPLNEGDTFEYELPVFRRAE